MSHPDPTHDTTDYITTAVREVTPEAQSDGYTDVSSDYEEYPYDCSCGECYQTVEAAINCRKCRTYTSAGYCTEVTTVGGNVVWKIGECVSSRWKKPGTGDAEAVS